MILHGNRLLAYLIFFRKLGNILQKLSYAAVVIDALRVNKQPNLSNLAYSVDNRSSALNGLAGVILFTR